MTATHKPFKSAALGYHNIRKFIKDTTSVTNPTSIDKIYKALQADVKNIQQVRDAIKKFRERNEIICVREGVELAIWWRENNGINPVSIVNDTEIKTQVTASPILTTPTYDNKDKTHVTMPEVQITKHAINILAGGVKITIERY